MRVAVGLFAIVVAGCSLERAGIGESVEPTDAVIGDDVSADAAFESSLADTSLDDVFADTSADDTAPAADTTKEAAPDTKPDVMLDTAPVDPLYIECESGTLAGEMTLAASASASGAQWASVPTTATPWSVGSGAPPTRVELPVSLPAGTWYVWVSMYTRAGDADAMYVGFEGSPLRRFFSLDWNKFAWVGAEGSGARLEFALGAGPNKLYVGAGEAGTGCDRVALTRVATWVPP